jgi:group II intron reverse transcriptase/maturase
MTALVVKTAAPVSTARKSVPPLTALQAQVYREARSARPVPRLMTWLLDRRNLEAAWERVRSSDGAETPGADGMTVADVSRQGPSWLTRLADELFRCRYHPGEVRWIEIPKPNKPGQVRRLGILTLRDRVVLTAFRQVLEPVLEPVFLPTSFGFRPGRSVPAALAEAVRLLTPRSSEPPPFTFAVHLDVADCFDTIDHALLLAELNRHVGDAELLRLLEQFLVAGGVSVNRLWWKRRRGLVQGSSLSPLLCNLALHPLDLALADLGEVHEGGLAVLRYADDLLLLARDARLAERGLACTRKVLSRLQQQLRQPVAVPSAIQQGVDWLGATLRPRVQPWTTQTSFGYAVPDRKVTDMLARLSEMTTPPSEKIDAGAFNLGRWLVSINDQLRDWRQAYLYADNAPEVFRALDDHCRFRVAELLASVTGQRRGQVWSQYRVRLPRGFSTWQVPGARLTVLSSLAPHCPGNLIRRPAWMSASALPPAEEPPPAPKPPLTLPGK